MKQVIIFFAFGVPAVLALLIIGGDLRFYDPPEPPQIPTDKRAAPPEPIAPHGSPIRQKIFNWEYRHFDPRLGVFDWFARGAEAVPLDDDVYEVKNPSVLFSAFTTTTPLLKKMLTRMESVKGRIERQAEFVIVDLAGGVAVTNTELFAPGGPTIIKLRTDALFVRAANHAREGEVAAELHTDSEVHLTGPSFEVSGKGGMHGATELSRVTILPPIVMHIAAREAGLFFGKKTSDGKGSRRIDVKGKGPLVLERLVEHSAFLMSMTDGVSVTDGDFTIESDKLAVALGESGVAELATARGDVVVKQGGEPRLYCDEVKWNEKTGRTELSGGQGVKFVESGNKLIAKTATLLEDRKTMLLEGGLEARFRGPSGAGQRRQPLEREWWVFCDRADVFLESEGGSLKAREVRLRPASGQKVVVKSSEGVYEVTGGTVVWNAPARTLEIKEKPQLARGKLEWVRSKIIFVRLADNTVLFEGGVVAELAAGGALWRFDAGRMVAKFERAEGEDVRIKSVTLENDTGQVKINYAGEKGEKVTLISGRASWDASTQVVVLDTLKTGKKPRLEHEKDWVEADGIVFDPRAKKGVFEKNVQTHLETMKRAGDVPGDGPQEGVEPPFAMVCEKLTVEFEQDYSIKAALAEGGVRFSAESKGLVLKCETSRYVAGREITFEGKERPRLFSGKNKISAEKIAVDLSTGRINFTGGVEGNFDDGKGAKITLTCLKMIAVYSRVSSSMSEVYFEGKVHIETEGGQFGKLDADGERGVYEVGKGEISLLGKPVVIRQKGLVAREEKIVYDTRNCKWFTGPVKKGYDWEIDRRGWRKKK